MEVEVLDVRTAIKERVGGYCSAHGVTRKQLAADMGMPYTTFSTKLHGPSEFSFSEGVALAGLLGIGPDELAGLPNGNPDQV